MRWLLFFLHISFFIHAQEFANAQVIDSVDKRYGQFAKKRFLSQEELVKSLDGKSDEEKLTAVNDFFNYVKYSTDEKIYNMSDYWATPFQFLGQDTGDCEDYVIAKYFLLKHVGIAPEKMYFTYVKSTQFEGAHMVLTYFKTPKSIPLVLDNNNLKVLPASQRGDLKPIYNFNGDLITNEKDGKTHKKWDELIKNIKENKI